MFSAIIYVLATTSLFIGSTLTFQNDLPDYFYIVGTGLFLLNSIINLCDAVEKFRHRNYEPLFNVL
jgi:hypothetical protein